MSSYIRDYINPKTGKSQNCLCIDDWFGRRQYGYFFRKDGKDADFNQDRFNNDWDIYRWEDLPKPTD